jgi:AcrR family transcriptional regulator
MEPISPALARIHRAAMELFAEKGQTQVTVSELAQAAGIARGTVYNNVPSPETLFEAVSAQLAAEMNQRISAGFEDVIDPPQRLANGIRHYIRRAHEEPYWGRFLSRFAFSHRTLQGMWSGPPMRDVLNGLANRDYDFRPEQLPSVIAMIAGSVLTSMYLVLEGHRTWRDAGSDTAELVLRGMGVDAETARRIATAELPPLPDGT